MGQSVKDKPGQGGRGDKQVDKFWEDQQRKPGADTPTKRHDVRDTHKPPPSKPGGGADKKQEELDEARLVEVQQVLLFGVRRSIRYHSRRRHFYERVHTTSAILTALAGAATIASVLGSFGQPWTIGFATAVAVSSAIDLVVGTDRAARMHDDLSRRFTDLEKAIITTKHSPDEALAGFTASRLDIEINEPPVLKVLDSICHNELLRAMGFGESHYLRIKWYQRLFCNFFDLMEHSIGRAKCEG